MNSNREWIKWLSYIGKSMIDIGKMSYVSFNNNSKQKKPRCVICSRQFDNYLIFILHIQIIHEVLYIVYREILK